MQFRHFFSVDSAKAVKAQSFGYLNAINYMAPAATAGVGNLCPHASAGCLALCLGWYSGQAGIVPAGQEGVGNNAARKSRVAKAQLFMRDRKAFMMEMFYAICRVQYQARKLKLTPCFRLNGATDIAWEGVKTHADVSIFELFPEVQFVDYTKNVRRALAHAYARNLWPQRDAWPANYHLTFSRSETNWADCVRVLQAGGNVAVVFAGKMPATYGGRPVVSGDHHDLRHLDPKASTQTHGQGVIIGLSPKGLPAKRDQSGFVVR
jgi:hypothetical protein